MGTMTPLRCALLMLAAPLALAGCSRSDDGETPAAMSASEDQALKDAAEMIEADRLPASAIPPTSAPPPPASPAAPAAR